MDNAKEKATLAGTGAASITTFDDQHNTPQVTSGQCVEAFNQIRQHLTIASPRPGFFACRENANG